MSTETDALRERLAMEVHDAHVRACNLVAGVPAPKPTPWEWLTPHDRSVWREVAADLMPVVLEYADERVRRALDLGDSEWTTLLALADKWWQQSKECDGKVSMSLAMNACELKAALASQGRADPPAHGEVGE